MTKPENLHTLATALENAARGGYAIGSFAPRYTSMIAPVLRAGQKTGSPLIVQVSQRELTRYGIDCAMFSAAFFAAMQTERITVPVVLHLDHTFEKPVIVSAIDAGFTSVMIDQSEKPLEENIRVTVDIV